MNAVAPTSNAAMSDGRSARLACRAGQVKGTTAGLAPGLCIFDTTLGKPVWRNAANNGWVDATGTGA